MLRNLPVLFNRILKCSPLNSEPIRQTHILRRKYPARLNKLEGPQKKLKGKFYYYLEVEQNEKEKEIELILLKKVKKIGNPGEVIKVEKLKAYEHYILTGAAALATPENMKKYSCLKDENAIPVEIENIISSLCETPVPVVMNGSHPWTLEPWHIKVALRKIGIVCNEDCIKLPDKEISGPNQDIEGKDFAIYVTVNKTYTSPMRCRLFHGLGSDSNVTTVAFNPKFYLEPINALFPEEQSLLEKIPLPQETEDPLIIIEETQMKSI